MPQLAAQGAASGFHTLPSIRGWLSTHVVSAQGIEAELRSVATRSEAIGAESPTRRRRDAPKNQKSKQYFKANNDLSRVCQTPFSD
jgi:hypothetical protein